MYTTLKDIVISFIQSIDLYNYLLKHHHRRTAVIAWHLANACRLDENAISNTVLTAAIHDIGALSVEERNQLIVMDIIDPHPHARMGSYMVESFEPFKKISQIIFYHHWAYEFEEDYIREKGPVPFESYIIHVADRLDILIDQARPILSQRSEIRRKIQSLSGTLFHPEVVDAFQSLAETKDFWYDIDRMDMSALLSRTLSGLSFELTLDILEQLAFTFSKIIDYRSQFTAAHSFGVSEVAYAISRYMGYDETKCRRIRVAGLLHDIGKIGVASELIERPAGLTSNELKEIQSHAYYTDIILGSVKSMEDIGYWASHHHESHDGLGYPHHFTKADITEEMDILAYSDIFTALVENRPYRQGLPLDRVILIIINDFEVKHGAVVSKVIQHHANDLMVICQEALADGLDHYDHFLQTTNRYRDQTKLKYNMR